MSQKLQVTHGRVSCPATGGRPYARNCKTCEHCRIFLDDTVKCSYEHDTFIDEHPMVHPL